MLQPDFQVKENRLIVGGQEFKNYKIIKEIGNGANGVVYHAENTILQRDEAIKIWRSRNPRDSRNKIAQGLREAQKLAKVSPEFAVAIYSAQEFGGALIATMEYVEGNTLDWHCKNSGPNLRIGLSDIYLTSIVRTTTAATRHGDAHASNVLVFEERSKFETIIKIKLCDFGTSAYAGKEASEERHWKIVRETILALTHGVPHRESCMETLNEDWPKGLKIARDAYAAREQGIDFSDFDIARMWSSPLKGYINGLKTHNFKDQLY